LTFWVTYPRVNLVKLWVLMPIAFVVITILFMGVKDIDPPDSLRMAANGAPTVMPAEALAPCRTPRRRHAVAGGV
jgi:hypothetical protein